MADGGDGTGSGDGSATDGDGPAGGVDDETVVRTAAEAAEGVVFSRFSRSEVDDLDVTVSFEDRILEVDVYLDVADGTDGGTEGAADPDRVAEDAALAARGAVDDLLE